MFLVFDKDKVLKNVGYKTMDINGDDVPELLIGNAHNKAGGNEDGGIYALFTLVDDKPLLVLTGTARDQSNLCCRSTIYSCDADYRNFLCG